MNIEVVKFGSQLVTQQNGQLNRDVLAHLLEEIAKLRKAGKKMVIVTSGAVAAGRACEALQGKFSVDRGASNDIIARGQVLAAVGQSQLMAFYVAELKKYSINCAQILVTRADFEDRERYVSLNKVAENLLQNNIVPIFNENDVLSTEELAFGDNDHLACMVTAMLVADRLVILTSVPGVYDPTATGTSGAKVLSEIKEIEPLLGAVSRKAGKMGSGGIYSKLLAANFCTKQGIPMYIASGFENYTLSRIILKGESVGTFFPVTGKRKDARRTWLSLTKGKGKIVVSTLIADLLRKKQPTSIILTGIESIEGTFNKGEVVAVFDENSLDLGRGQVRYSSDDLRSVVSEYRASTEAGARVAGGDKLAIHYNDFVFSN